MGVFYGYFENHDDKVFKFYKNNSSPPSFKRYPQISATPENFDIK